MLDQTGYIKKFIISYTLFEYFGGIVRWKTTNVKGTRISVRGRGSNSFPPTALAPVGRTRSLILKIFFVTMAGGRARMEGAKKRSGNTLRDLQHFSYHTESESSNFLAIS